MLIIETLEGHRQNNRVLHYSWAEPLTSAIAIPNRMLQLLVLDALGRLRWRAHTALPKIHELRRAEAADAEIRQAADAAIRLIDPE